MVAGFNDFLEGIYGSFGIEVADVERAFSVTDLALQPSGLPANVQQVCAWTWMCSEGDIHPNTDGYGVIARTFAEELGNDFRANGWIQPRGVGQTFGKQTTVRSIAIGQSRRWISHGQRDLGHAASRVVSLREVRDAP